MKRWTHKDATKAAAIRPEVQLDKSAQDSDGNESLELTGIFRIFEFRPIDSFPLACQVVPLHAYSSLYPPPSLVPLSRAHSTHRYTL